VAINDPIEYLRQRYIGVMDSLQVLVLSLEGLAGEQPSLKTLDLLLRAAEEVRDEIWAYSERLKAVLIPVLEPKLDGDGTIPVILREHQAFHRGLGRLIRLIGDLKAEPARKELQAEVAESIRSLSYILTGAIRGEDETLYPLARRLLTPEEVAQVQKRLDRSGLGEEPQDGFLDTEREHEELLHLLSGLAKTSQELHQGIVTPEGLKAFERVQRALAYEVKEHNRVEEEVLFQFLETQLPLAEMTRELREEHIVLWDLLKKASLGFRKAHSHPREAGKTLEELIRKQALHIYKENILLFPMARRLFPEEKLKDLARRVAAFELRKKRGREDFVQESYREVEALKALIEGPGVKAGPTDPPRE